MKRSKPWTTGLSQTEVSKGIELAELRMKAAKLKNVIRETGDEAELYEAIEELKKVYTRLGDLRERALEDIKKYIDQEHKIE